MFTNLIADVGSVKSPPAVKERVARAPARTRRHRRRQERSSRYHVAA